MGWFTRKTTIPVRHDKYMAYTKKGADEFAKKLKQKGISYTVTKKENLGYEVGYAYVRRK